VKSEWRRSENKQRAKYYNLTAAGKKHLVAEQSRWDRGQPGDCGFEKRPRETRPDVNFLETIPPQRSR